jgi:peptide/nickel transport system ATP-binding protein
VVERVSHRIAVMLLGEIVEIGPRDAVLSNPRHPYTRKLIEAVPVPDPSTKGRRRGLIADELKSPVRSLGWNRPERRMISVGPDHFVMED